LQDPVTGLVVALFSASGVALGLAGAILGLALVLIASSELFDQRPLIQALLERSNLISGVGSRKVFVEQFPAIDLRFTSSSSPPLLVRGWRTYRSLLVRNEDQTFATSIHAADAFDRLDEPARAMEWWANILVAIGLTITFLGIVAALSEATSAIAASGGAGASGVEAALLGLLAIAATKFWTSIAGILGSIILRFVARRRRLKIETLQADLFESLDVLVEFAPPERVMIEQLAVLRRLESRLSLSPEAS
jgi:hypothetical protein